MAEPKHRGRAADWFRCWSSGHTAAGLDRELAAGANPNRSAPLAARARLLLGTSTRLSTAAILESLIRESPHPSPSWPIAPVRWHAVRAATPQLTQLAERLRNMQPVSPQGIARARILLTDGTGPLYGPPDESGLWTATRAAILGLDFGPSYPSPPPAGASRSPSPPKRKRPASRRAAG